MKKLVYLFVTVFAMSLFSCGQADKAAVASDSDTVVVDTVNVDSVQADSVAVDTVK